MAVIGALIQEGARVRVRRGTFPLDAAVIGQKGTIVEADKYQAHRYGVLIDGEAEVRYLTRAELEVIMDPGLPAERKAARLLRALP